jgi:CHAT domain-containing protein
VLGLQRAFQAAGVRAVVASLWKVDDAATGALMKQSYTNLWTKKLPKHEALRQAQLAVLNNLGLVEQERGLGAKAEPLPNGAGWYLRGCSRAKRPRALGRIRARRPARAATGRCSSPCAPRSPAAGRCTAG